MTQKSEPESILMVCYGNICRSPMAEYLMRETLRGSGLADRYTVSSAGVRALVGNCAARGAQAAADAQGLSLQGHEARLLTAAMALEADHLIAMDEVVEEEILILTGDCVDIELWPVDDPYGGSDEGYAVAFEEIRQHVSDWVSRHGLTTLPGDSRSSG